MEENVAKIGEVSLYLKIGIYKFKSWTLWEMFFSSNEVYYQSLHVTNKKQNNIKQNNKSFKTVFLKIVRPIIYLLWMDAH